MSEDINQEGIEKEVATAAEDDAAFEAGFAGARGDEPPTPEPAAEEPAKTEAEPEPAAEAEPEPEIVFAGLTENQLKAALAKAGEVDEIKGQVRQLFGRMGEFNSKLQQAQSASGGKLSAGQLSKLRGEYPEMADLLEADLSSLSVGGSQPQFDPVPMRQEMETKFSSELARITRVNEMKLLQIRHRDWETVRSSDDFTLWEQTLPTGEREKLNTSWDAMYIADQFDQFKSWREKSRASQQQKQNRLERAVTPKGVPNASPSSVNDDDAFMAGFQGVRRV